jgi:hypothetical protein
MIQTNIGLSGLRGMPVMLVTKLIQFFFYFCKNAKFGYKHGAIGLFQFIERLYFV